jgi:L-alanine-DL-glutamate epimerase-like enolase superfamily enzyme
MKLSAERFTIRLIRPFRIAHGSSDTRETILVKLCDGTYEGHGEGALPPYYPSRPGSSLCWLRELKMPLDAETNRIPPAPPDAAAARVAVEIALHDLWARRQGLPLWKAWNLSPKTIPVCARTLPIPESEDELREFLAEGGACFKLKVGSGDSSWDLEIVRLARELRPEARLSVDANGAWSPAQAAELLPQLACCDLEYVEQPVSPDREDWRKLRTSLAAQQTVPLIADESVQGVEDITAFRGLADGVNVKLLKAGGLAGARLWIDAARAAGLRVMIGVMVETGIGRTAAAQLAPLADWLDIDPPDSIPAAPLLGFELCEDRLILSDRPGLGLIPA